MKKRLLGVFLWLVVINLFLIDVSFSATNSTSILFAGDLCDWRVEHHGMNSSKYIGTNVLGPIKTVAAAFESAKNADQRQFATYLCSMGSWDWQELYDEWQVGSRQHIYLIVDEAIGIPSGHEPKSFAAVSFAPFGISSQQDKMNLSTLKAGVVFLIMTNHEWRISQQIGDAKLSNLLLGRAEPLVQKDVLIFHSEEEVQKWKKESAAQTEKKILDDMKSRGDTAAMVNSFKEDFALKHIGMRMVETNWEAWKKYYNFQEISPPVVFDSRDAWQADFSSLLAAHRSYEHAYRVGDGKTLYQFADDTGKNELERIVGDPKIKVATYELTALSNLTVQTVLFTATTKYEGKDYAMVFFRAQENQHPQSGRVVFQADFFKRTQDGYVYTDDLNTASTFGNPGRAAHLGFMMFSKYPEFYQTARKSEFPEYYYKIDK